MNMLDNHDRELVQSNREYAMPVHLAIGILRKLSSLINKV